MKIRRGFVSNSSSSSFSILLSDIMADQLYQIENHAQNSLFETCGGSEYDAWTISTSELEVIGNTDMDNFDMHFFLTKVLKINEDAIRWRNS